MSGEPRARTPTMARILNVSEVHLGRLAKQGDIPKAVSRGIWDVVETVNAYIALLEARVAGKDQVPDEVKSEELRLIAARREKTEEDRDMRAMQNAQMRGELVEIEEVARQVEAEYTVVRERLLGIPGKIAASLVALDRAAIESKIQDEITEALSELHDPAREGAGIEGAEGEAPEDTAGAETAAAPGPDRVG